MYRILFFVFVALFPFASFAQDADLALRVLELEKSLEEAILQFNLSADHVWLMVAVMVVFRLQHIPFCSLSGLFVFIHECQVT